ncbi:glycosyltransferase [Rhizobium leguminosarum]|uniref:glycosyltransferase n=1 Tax=Rhizobium leguminosarum TaxID=384 RepID=UPI001031306A|nr:glycosyltransferase [Rhizobium leguminosarum]TAU87471.1 glycosyltransferase [Rhizobium leguminosarum]TAV52002.1 glycosyltransferase [Rhizobium leguminosarum]
MSESATYQLAPQNRLISDYLWHRAYGNLILGAENGWNKRAEKLKAFCPELRAAALSQRPIAYGIYRMGSDPELAFDEAESPRRLIIHAPNVHSGGGAVLLNAILRASAGSREVVLICDQRMKVDPEAQSCLITRRFAPTVFGRLAAEREIRNITTESDLVLSFGNLPPIYRLKAATVLFLQNRYLVDAAMPLSGFRLGARIRLSAERVWLRRRLRNADRVIVQTDTMAALFEKRFGRKAEVAGFDSKQPESVLAHYAARKKLHDFTYISSGEPHKNHRTLIEAWSLLSEGGVTPSLSLTLSTRDSANLLALVEKTNSQKHTRIVNLGQLSASEVDSAYDSSGALIFPSLGESFGLPLVEAAERGMPILASELDYVRDLVVPAETFDPRSPRSIARAVCRFMKLPPDLNVSVTAGDFLKQVCEEKH